MNCGFRNPHSAVHNQSAFPHIRRSAIRRYDIDRFRTDTRRHSVPPPRRLRRCFPSSSLSLRGLPRSTTTSWSASSAGRGRWSRRATRSASSIVGPLFGFAAGWIVDRFGPRRLMMAGIVMAGGALVGLGAVSAAWAFYFFYFFNALGYVCGGPLPCQVLLSRWFDRDARPGDGDRVSRHRHRRRDRAAAGRRWLTDQSRLARIAAGARRADRADRVSARVSRPRAARRRSRRRSSSAAGRRASATAGRRASRRRYGAILQRLRLLPARARQHVLDRRRRRHEPASQAVSQPRSRLLAGRRRAASSRSSSTVSIAGRLLMGWLADRMPRKHVMLIIYLLVAGAIPLLLARVVAGRRCTCSRRSSASGSAAST